MKKCITFLLALSMTAALFTGCGSSAADSKTQSKASAAKPASDPAGNAITVPDKVEKIISMSPSETQELIDLGMADKIIACDTQSPLYTDQLPSGIPQFDMMSPDVEKITALSPDIVFTSGMSSSGGTDVFQSVRDAGICVADIPSASSIEAIKDDIRFIASCVDQTAAGEKIISDMQASVDKVSAIGAKITDKKTVLFEMYPSPSIYSVGFGTYIDEMITLIGAKNIMGDQKSWISVTDEAAIAANPDVILTSDTSVSDPVQAILTLPGWENVNAVKNSQVYAIDSASIMQPDENIVKALIQMAKAVYPDEYASLSSDTELSSAA